MLRATCGSFDTRVYLPFLQRICFKQLVEVSVLSCSLTSFWPASFLLDACQILWFLSLVSFSLPCLGAFFLLFLVLSWRFWTIYIFFKMFEFVEYFPFYDSKEQRYEGIKHHDVSTRNMYWSLARRLGWGKLDALYRVSLLLFHFYWPQVSKLSYAGNLTRFHAFV
jgi:hypothetical protein